MNGMLQHQYDVNSEDIYWFIGGLNSPAPRPLIPLNLTEEEARIFVAGKRWRHARDGELDALPLCMLPALFQSGSPRVMRLFPNYRGRAGLLSPYPIFPSCTRGSSDDLYREHPRVAESLQGLPRGPGPGGQRTLSTRTRCVSRCRGSLRYVERPGKSSEKTSGVGSSRIVRRWKRSTSMCTTARRAPSDPRSSLRRRGVILIDA